MVVTEVVEVVLGGDVEMNVDVDVDIVVVVVVEVELEVGVLEVKLFVAEPTLVVVVV